MTSLTHYSNSSLSEYLPFGIGAIQTTFQRKNQEKVSVFDFMTEAQKNEITLRSPAFDASPAFAVAVSVISTLGGGKIEVPDGAYLLNGIAGADGIKNGILLPFYAGSDHGATAKSINLIGNSREVAFLAGSNTMNVVRCSTSYSELANFSVFANGKTGVNAIALIPENTTTPASASQQSFNHIHDVYSYQCAEGLVMQCGGIGGAYYNTIGPAHFHGGGNSGTRGVYLKSGVGTGTPSNVNRNQFNSVRVGYANTGFEIESGDTNTFTGCSVEGITSGTMPNTIPTGVRVLNADTSGRGNEANRFIGFTAEDCTRDAELLNPRIAFFGFSLDATKCVLASDFGQIATMLGPYQTTVFPEIYSGIVNYGSNLPAGIGAYEYGLNYNQNEVFDRGYKFKTFALTSANVLGVDSVNADYHSGYTKFAGMVDFQCRFTFNPTATNSKISIPLPVRAQVALYGGYATISPMKFIVSISTGATPIITTGSINYSGTAGLYLEIDAPAALWNNAAGENNRVDLQMRYRAE